MQAFIHIFESIKELKQKHADNERRNAEALKRAKEEIEALLRDQTKDKADAKERS